VAGATRLTIEQELAGTLAPQCRAAIDNRYPFHAGSAADVTAEDFARVFGPGGLMDEFFQRRLAAHVDTNVRPWRFRQTGEGSIGGGASLIQFQRAAEIRRAFFQGGAAGPQVLQYAHGPAIPQTLQWPGTRGTNQIRIQASTGVAGAEAGLLFEGPWAALRMFDRAQVIPGSRPEQFRAVFRIDSRPIEFEVTTSSVQNPLRLDALRSFRCPGRL
jgi:type VI secretion system protein ImpL